MTNDEINLNLKEKYSDSLGYTPKVVAFLNENPHNITNRIHFDDLVKKYQPK